MGRVPKAEAMGRGGGDFVDDRAGMLDVLGHGASVHQDSPGQKRCRPRPTIALRAGITGASLRRQERQMIRLAKHYIDALQIRLFLIDEYPRARKTRNAGSSLVRLIVRQ